MTPERWHRITELFHAALARGSDARGPFIAASCGDDLALRHDVESMIDAHNRAGKFGETQVVAAAPPLEPGASVGPYRIEHWLGAGGMGEVYKARDTRLGRTVALKVLSPVLAGDPEFRARFEREARAISQLEHHHICALYDVGNHEGTSYFVMQYLDGESLAQRLERGAMTIDAALRTAIQITDALDVAHSNGIIHRDLKPANVFLTKSGVKLLDFGLAKTKAAVGGSSIETATPKTAVTTPGTILGTVPYMAPEQLEGQEADARTDLFALGAVVYEMGTGRMAFGGEHQAQVISSIMSADPPPMSTLRADVPAALERVVAACLAKDPEARWQSARDVKRALAWILEPTTATGTAVPPAKRTRRALATAGAALLAGAALSGVVAWTLARAAPPRSPIDGRAFRFELFPPQGGAFGMSSASMAVSPDGGSIAFHGQNERGESVIWVRSLDSLGARVLERAERGVQPFWSADSRFLAFIADGKLKTLDISSGFAQAVTDAAQQSGTWSRDGVIVFRQRDQRYLSRVPVGGGPPIPATALDQSRGETLHNWPQFLPDGRHFLYQARSTQSEYDRIVYVGSLDSTDRVALLQPDSHAAYAPQGYLLFVQSSTLVAQPFDARTLRTTGEPVPLADGVEVNGDTRRGAFSVSHTGVLAYRTVGETQLTWFDRTGRQLEAVGSPGRYRNPALSPDEQRVAVARIDPETDTSDIWVIELARGVTSRLTFDPSTDDMPLWSRDGNRIVFRAARGGRFGLYQKAPSGSGPEELLLATATTIIAPLDWSVDGRFLIYEAQDGEATSRWTDLWRVPVSGDRKPIPLLRTEFRDAQGQLSPDGRWIAYVSNSSGRNEVNVRPFPSGEGNWQISTDGGVEPQWRGDGKEVFFVAPDQSLMAVEVTTGSTVRAGLPVQLFASQMRGTAGNTATRNQYVASSDGQRFLLNHLPRGRPPSSSFTVVLNWMAALEQ